MCLLEQPVVELASVSDRAIINNLFQFYLYDLSEFIALPTTGDGEYRFDDASLDRYWYESDHHPFLIRLGTDVCGFCLVRNYSKDSSVKDIEQFFVMRKYRREGVGQAAFRQCVEQFMGHWQVRVLLENKPAFEFWRRAISEVSSGQYTLSLDMDDDLEMSFFRFSVCKGR